MRYLGVDLSLVYEVCRIRGFQEQLVAQQPDDPRRIFGEAVEATGSSLGECMARVCTDIVARALPQVVDKLTAHIDERLAHLGDNRQRVNLTCVPPSGRRRTTPRSLRTLRRRGSSLWATPLPAACCRTHRQLGIRFLVPLRPAPFWAECRIPLD